VPALWVRYLNREAKPLTDAGQTLFRIVLSAAIVICLVAPFWPTR
jgi:hypothetical protein